MAIHKIKYECYATLVAKLGHVSFDRVNRYPWKPTHMSTQTFLNLFIQKNGLIRRKPQRIIKTKMIEQNRYILIMSNMNDNYNIFNEEHILFVV